jgi:hypothetical protein
MGGIMKKILTVLAAAITLAGPVALSMPATAALASVCQENGTGCTKAATYTENALINSDYSGFKVVWVKSVVASYPSGSIPVTWTAKVRYTNLESSSQTLGCPGDWPDASYVSEDLSGGSGDTDGSVSAASTHCSQDPSQLVTVPANGTYTSFATFHNVPWPGTAVAIAWGDAGTSPNIYPFGSGDTDWADSSFCAQSWPNAPNGAPYTGTTYNGVAACGNAENALNTSNSQGTISYKPSGGATVYFDSAGFQCVELAARYFYFQTTLVPDKPKTPPTGADFVATEHQNHTQDAISSATNKFQSSITPGNIISMWSSSDPDGEGHVGVVMGFQKTNGNVTGINIMDENGNGTGTSTIKVSAKGAMSFDGYNEFQWTTNLPGSG